MVSMKKNYYFLEIILVFANDNQKVLDYYELFSLIVKN